MALAHATPHIWTIEEYYRLFEAGIFKETDKVELLEGVIVQMAAQGVPHILGITHANETLVLTFHDTHNVTCQCNLDLPPRSSPIPDFWLWPKSVVPEMVGPAGVDLVIEVANTSLPYDSKEKASVYAKYGIREYWIVDVAHRMVKVHRNPQPDAKAVFGYRYADVTSHKENSTVSPLFRPEAAVPVKALL